MTQQEAERAAFDCAAKLVKKYRKMLKAWKGVAVVEAVALVAVWMMKK